MEDAMLSSPDPLNDTPAFQSPQKSRRSSKARKSLHLQGSSPKKQTFELDVGDQISPQKIRVTVEAGDSDIENAYFHHVQSRDNSPSKSRAPKNRRRERTITTTVPVKGLSDSEEETQHAATPKRGRGRPRKSIGTPVPAKKAGRATTPTRKPYTRRKSIGEPGAETGEEGNLPVGVEIGRGGSRSRSRKATARKSTPAAKQSASSDQVVSSTTSKKGRGRRKTLQQEDIPVLEDIRNDTSAEDEGAGISAEMSGALQPINANENHPSAYSTIRSMGTVDDIDDAYPDVVIARFDPGNETPRRTGWSSPRIIEAPRPSSPIQPHTASEKSTLTEDDESVGMVPVPASDKYQREDHGYQYEEEEEERDGLGEMREFDTILESEEFSMISVDSVPSLREHLSSPHNQDQESENPKDIKNKQLLIVQEDAYDDSFSEIPEEVLEAATPARKAPNSQLLSVQNSRLDDSFSSIPPDVLEAASPVKKSQVSRFTSNNGSRFERSSPNIATTLKATSEPTVSAQNQDLYEDSFSAIPEDVLDAATPAPKPQAAFMWTGSQAGPKSDGLKVPLTLNLSHSQRSQSPRLLTPEETPSPPAESSNTTNSRSSGRASSRSAGRTSEGKWEIETSVVHSHMPSSPPSAAPRRYTYTAHLRNHRQLHPDVTETPSIVFSSPSLPPPIQHQRAQAIPGQSSQQRPALSPIARTGQVLQNIRIPSPSRSRSQSLGSPFKSPISDRKSSSVARELQPSPSQHRIANPLPRMDLNGNLAALSAQENSWNSPAAQEDPFNNSSHVSQRPSSSEERSEYSLELPSQRGRGVSDPRLSTTKSMPGSLRSEGAMSWQAEEEVVLSSSALSSDNVSSFVAAKGSFSGTNTDNMTWAERDAAERAAVVKQVEAASEVIVINSDEEEPKSPHNDEDEDFDLLLETMNSSSPIAYERPEPPKQVLEKPRRSKIPSPWRKNSKRLVYNDELSHLSSPTLASTAGVVKGFAANTSNPVTVRRIIPEQQEKDDGEADLSGWQIPQKSNFQPRPRESGNLDLSALLASPGKKLPVMSTASKGTSARLERNSDRSLSRETSKELTPDVTATSSKNTSSLLERRSDRSQSREISKEPSPALTTTNSRADKPFAPIAQKQGFNPRPRSELASSPLKQQA
ncbi:hypothetical protein LSUE1_G010270, partial [Lachnellula suecica]